MSSYAKPKSGLSKLNTALLIILIIAVVFLVVIVAFNIGGDSESKVYEDSSDSTSTSTSTEGYVIDEFVAGTYGGVDFESMEDVVNYYVEAYNYTKTLTATYDDNGTTATYYKLLGEEALTVENVLVEGSANSMIDSLVPSILDSLFSGSVKGLPPSGSLVSGSDTIVDGTIDVNTALLEAEDVAMASVVDNGDGTITISIQPEEVVLSYPGQDAQGHFFNTLGDITSTVESISILSFSEGTIDENFVVTYSGGYGTITIDTSTMEITEAYYEMLVHVDVQHACVAVITDKSASLDIVYTNTFPASDEFLEEKGITAQ